MGYIIGKIRQKIYESETGYKVGLFRIKETDDEEMDDFLNKTITFTGVFADLNYDDSYKFYGELTNHERFGYQYNVKSYERLEPVGKDAIVEFLSSPLIKGCGEKTALKIVETLGEDAIAIIKQNATNLLAVSGMSDKKALKIYESIMKYSSSDELLIYLKELGFSMNQGLNIVNKYGDSAKSKIEENIYMLGDLIEFNLLDKIYLGYGDEFSEVRIKACIIESMKRLSDSLGDTYYYFDEIILMLNRLMGNNNSIDVVSRLIGELITLNEIVVLNDKYYLKNNYDMEEDIAYNLKLINSMSKNVVSDFATLISGLERGGNVEYNQEQKNAIKTALENRVSIITGGPGTGKTTIINAIVKLYTNINKVSPFDLTNTIALLAPTGRASKKMADSTGLCASTIHRYLKWNHEKDEFQINEDNKNQHKLIIVDEVSMVDTYLMDSLLKGINHNVQLIVVGDTSQLPSVGAGHILNDMINSEIFSFCPLNRIYRQSENSYIAYLAKEIKEHSLSESFTDKKDDFNFLETSSSKIKEMIKKICEKSLEKGIMDSDIQILAPMYKGENGIDNLNIILQELFNPKNKDKNEEKVWETVFREKDKVLQLVNDPDNNVFNGDIGYIRKIEKVVGSKKVIFTIDFDGNYIEYEKEDMSFVRHAYAISIHKSQGSEFLHVIMPVSRSYNKMLYNKLIYTGVSRAKKSLVVIGEKNAFVNAVANDYSKNRKTTLKDKLIV